MSKKGAKNLFISHVHEDDGKLQQMKDLLGKSGYEIRDASIDSSKPNNAKNPDYIKSEILAPGIRWAGALVVLISPQTHTSKWVEWEIDYAQKNDTRIVGVWAQGAKDSDVPEALQKYADAVVGWQADQIMDAVKGKINNWTNPDGTERPPRNIDRIDCQ